MSENPEPTAPPSEGDASSEPERPLRIVLAMQLCDVELDLCEEAVKFYLACTPGFSTHVVLTDDASKTGAGEEAVRRIERLGLTAELLPMDIARGFHGTGTRVGMLLKHSQAHGGDYDLVVKTDSDLLFISKRLGPMLRELAAIDGPMLAGQRQPLRRRDAILMFGDMFPLGFRRKVVDDVLEHKWTPRFRPTVTTGAGFRAIRHGYRFTFFGGGMLILNRPLLDAMAARNLLDWPPQRLGLLFHDDVLTSVLAASCNPEMVELSAYGTLRLMKGATLEEHLKPDWCFVHPVKTGPEGDQLRAEVRARLEG
jgi:hypothetical protein